MKACVWWKGMQEAILSQNQDAFFCEEYCCVTRSVAADGRGFSLQLQEICNRYRRSPVHVIPQFPHFHYWISHDALTPCGESSMTPRILQPLRPSSYTVQGQGTWGADDGKAGNLTAENLVSDTHCFLCVEAAMPKQLTLSQLLGSMVRRLADSFHAAGFCCPWWIPEHMIKAGPHSGNKSSRRRFFVLLRDFRVSNARSIVHVGLTARQRHAPASSMPFRVSRRQTAFAGNFSKYFGCCDSDGLLGRVWRAV